MFDIDFVTPACSACYRFHDELKISMLPGVSGALHRCSSSLTDALFSIQEVVKLPLEFVRQLSIKVQHQRPGETEMFIACFDLWYFCNGTMSCSQIKQTLSFCVHQRGAVIRWWTSTVGVRSVCPTWRLQPSTSRHTLPHSASRSR